MPLGGLAARWRCCCAKRLHKRLEGRHACLRKGRLTSGAGGAGSCSSCARSGSPCALHWATGSWSCCTTSRSECREDLSFACPRATPGPLRRTALPSRATARPAPRLRLVIGRACCRACSPTSRMPLQSQRLMNPKTPFRSSCSSCWPCAESVEAASCSSLPHVRYSRTCLIMTHATVRPCTCVLVVCSKEGLLATITSATAAKNDAVRWSGLRWVNVVSTANTPTRCPGKTKD